MNRVWLNMEKRRYYRAVVPGKWVTEYLPEFTYQNAPANRGGFGVAFTSGAVIGSIASVAVQFLNYYLQERSSINRNKPKKDLLLKMLESPKYKWRKLNTLMHVIGSDEETTKRLLLEVGARASEDGQPIWGLITRNPLPQNIE